MDFRFGPSPNAKDRGEGKENFRKSAQYRGAAAPSIKRSMARLRHQQLKAFSGALLELYSPGRHADLADGLSLLQRCLSFDSLAYHDIVDNQNQRAIFYPEIPFDSQAFENLPGSTSHFERVYQELYEVLRKNLRFPEPQRMATDRSL